MKDHDYLTVYHTNLRNIGLFITIALAANNFKYKTKIMKKIGLILIPLIFLLISLILNLELLYLVYEHNDNNEALDLVPYLTMILLIVLIIKIVYNLFYI